MLWIFSALCKAVWLIWNALSNTGMYTGIKSHSKTDSDTEHWRTQQGKLLFWRVLLLSLYAESSTAPSSSLSARLARISTKVRAKRVHSSLCGTASCRKTSRELIRTLVVRDWFSLWTKTEAPLWGELLPQSARLCMGEAPRHGPHQPTGDWYLASVAKFMRHIWQFPSQYQPEGAFSQGQSKRPYLLDFVVLLQNLPFG